MIESNTSSVPTDIDPTLNIEFKLSELNAILSFLAKLPYGDVSGVINGIRDRGIKAVDKFISEKATGEDVSTESTPVDIMQQNLTTNH